MKTLLLVVMIMVASTAAFAAVGVSVEDNFFTPQNITIPAGTTVIWTDNGFNPHTVTSGDVGTPSGLFDSPDLSQGQTFSFTFKNPGVYPYYCRVHGAMGMVGTVTVTCGNTSQLLKNPGFESGAVNWASSPAGIINNSTTFPPHTGKWKAQLNGKGVTNTASIMQSVTIPSNACTAKLSFFLRVATVDTGSIANDKLRVQILSSGGAVLKTFATYSNLNKSASYIKHSFNLMTFKGKTVKVRFIGTENASLKTTFLIDDTAVTITN